MQFQKLALLVLFIFLLNLSACYRPRNFHITTPDIMSVKRWKEVETTLAWSILSSDQALCEWDILGRSGQVIYVWAVCQDTTENGSAASVPVAIHTDKNSVILEIEIPDDGTKYADDILEMFPAHVRERFDLYNSGKAGEMLEHLEFRKEHPNVPPLIVLNAPP